MKLLQLAIITVFVCFTLVAKAQMVNHETSTLLISPEYIINENAALRNDSNVNAPLLKTLPIGTICYLIDKGSDTVTVNGVQSQWYKAKTDGLTGWIWGGNIAQFVFGSNQNPDVKFLLGYGAHETLKDVSGYEYTSQMVHLKAVKNNKVLDKISISMWPFYFDAAIYGNYGLENVKDVLTVHEPCVGGCGCSTGDTYVFWDGKKLHNTIFVGGTADADFSEWSSIVFPSNAGGEKGYIITYDDGVLDNREVGSYPYPQTIIKRQLTITYYKWNGTKLEVVKEKPVTKKVYYVDSETQKTTTKKPELWEDKIETEEGE